MKVLTVLLQIVLTLFLVASLMPVVLALLPEARPGRAGGVAMAAIAVAVFVILRLVWPRRVR